MTGHLTDDAAVRTAPDETSLWSAIRHVLVRSRDDRVLSGLAGGIAARTGIPSAYVRAAFLTAVMAGGIGLALYLLGWALSADADGATAVHPEPSSQRLVAYAFLYGGFLMLMRGLGLWFGDGLVLPVALVAFGSAAVWDRTGARGRERISRLSNVTSNEPPSRSRLLFGALLMAGGLAFFVASLDRVTALGPALVAIGLTTLGFLLVFGPWVFRLTQDLADERRDRIRSDERSDMAAHLHDSVLQTLALIQRTDDPKRMVTLARAQERELREWLYVRRDDAVAEDLETALGAAAARIESAHDVPIEVVVVGNLPIDDRLQAAVQAAGEAMNNAALHSGADRVSVFAEVGDGGVDIYVTDQGTGFDRSAVGVERRGIADSIVGRMERNGGSAAITSDAGEGTEVHLHMGVEQ